jgi:hypothetical protein
MFAIKQQSALQCKGAQERVHRVLSSLSGVASFVAVASLVDCALYKLQSISAGALVGV